MGYGRLQRSTTVVCNYKLFVPSFASCVKSILISVTDFRYCAVHFQNWCELVQTNTNDAL